MLRIRVSAQQPYLDKFSSTDLDTGFSSYARPGNSGGPAFLINETTGRLEIAGIINLGDEFSKFLGMSVGNSGEEACRVEAGTPVYSWLQSILQGQAQPTVVGADWVS